MGSLFGSLRRILWIGGGQWAGKSTVARLLALRYGLTAYHFTTTTTTPAATMIDGSPAVSGSVSLPPPRTPTPPGPTPPRQMVVMVPTEAFRDRQLHELTPAAAFGSDVSDPARAQRNRLERDRLVADDAVHSARRLGIRVLEIDGTRDAGAVAGAVADHFHPCLPPEDLWNPVRP